MRSPEEWGLGRGSQQCPLQLDGLGSAVSSAIGSGAKPRGAGWFFMHFKNYRYATSWIQELTSEQHQTHHLSCLPFSCRFSVLATELWGPIVDWMGSFSNKLGRGGGAGPWTPRIDTSGPIPRRYTLLNSFLDMRGANGFVLCFCKQ